MKYYKGDVATLFCEFTYEGKTVTVDNPKIRILHEFKDKVYEDTPWTPLSKLENGYSYDFDTNICDNYGQYVAVCKGMYQKQELIVMNKFDITARNMKETNSIEIYGYVNDINNSKLLKNVKVQIKDLESNNMIYQTNTDEDGKWTAYIFPNDYEFIFNIDGYEERSIRAQVGDEHKEIQFNTIGLENIKDKALGDGLYRIEDEFTSKNDMGIENIQIVISQNNATVVETKTDKRGKWKVFLNDGHYIMKITLPSGINKIFQLNIYNDGNHVLEELKSNTTTTKTITDNGSGSEKVVDYVLDAHGNGIPDINIKAYKYDAEKDDYIYVCEDITSSEGQFTLNLDKGHYKFKVSGDGFKPTEQKLEI